MLYHNFVCYTLSVLRDLRLFVWLFASRQLPRMPFIFCYFGHSLSLFLDHLFEVMIPVDRAEEFVLGWIQLQRTVLAHTIPFIDAGNSIRYCLVSKYRWCKSSQNS
jgi:hypothetical protein